MMEASILLHFSFTINLNCPKLVERHSDIERTKSNRLTQILQQQKSPRLLNNDKETFHPPSQRYPTKKKQTKCQIVWNTLQEYLCILFLFVFAKLTSKPGLGKMHICCLLSDLKTNKTWFEITHAKRQIAI